MGRMLQSMRKMRDGLVNLTGGERSIRTIGANFPAGRLGRRGPASQFENHHAAVLSESGQVLHQIEAKFRTSLTQTHETGDLA